MNDFDAPFDDGNSLAVIIQKTTTVLVCRVNLWSRTISARQEKSSHHQPTLALFSPKASILTFPNNGDLTKEKLQYLVVVDGEVAQSLLESVAGRVQHGLCLIMPIVAILIDLVRTVEKMRPAVKFATAGSVIRGWPAGGSAA